MSGCTVGISRPRDDYDAGDGRPLAEVDHPDRCLDVEVVEHRAWLDAVVDVAVPIQLTVVDGVVAGCVLMTASVPLVLASTVDERVLLVGQVLNCTATHVHGGHSVYGVAKKIEALCLLARIFKNTNCFVQCLAFTEKKSLPPSEMSGSSLAGPAALRSLRAAITIALLGQSGQCPISTRWRQTRKRTDKQKGIA